jgi:hypothetical protein
MRSEAELKALLESISTHDPNLKVRGVVKTPTCDQEGKPIEGRLLPDGEVQGGVKESELPSPLLGKHKVMNLLRIRWQLDPAVQGEHAPMKEPQKAIYRNDIARFRKAGIKALYKKLAGLINYIPIGKVTDDMVRALKQRLQRSSRAKK